MSVKRLLLVIPALAGLGWIAAQALRIGSADAIVYDASKEMTTWMASGNRAAEQTMSWVHDDLQRAAARVPADATVQELLGLLQIQRVDRQEYLDDAIVHFVKALERRPTSPYSWSNLAEAQYRKGDTSKSFEAALRRAAELGPNEPEVQRTVVDFGLAVWDEVTPVTQTAIDGVIALGMKRNPLEMLQIAGRRGRLGLACRHFADSKPLPESKWTHLCQSTEAIR